MPTTGRPFLGDSCLTCIEVLIGTMFPSRRSVALSGGVVESEKVTLSTLVRLICVERVGLNANVRRVWERFWTPKRQKVYSILLVGLAIFWTVAFSAYRGVRDKQYGADFIVFYATSGLTLDGVPEQAYVPEEIYNRELLIADDAAPDPFRYPPPFLLALAPLALAPYAVALIVWLSATGAALATSVRRLFTGWSGLLTLAVFPSAFVNATYGQNGFLTAALIGGGLSLLDRRPAAAGVLLGGLMYKPQFLVVTLLGLLVARRWKALGFLSVSVAILSLLSYLLLGSDVWVAFYDSGKMSVDSMYIREIATAHVSALTFGVLLGLPRLVSQILQVAVALPALGVVAVAWIRPTRPAIRNSVTVVGTLVVSPYVFHYDMVMLIPVLGWLMVEAARWGWPKYQKQLLGVSLAAPLWSFGLTSVTNLQLGWVALVALLASMAMGILRSDSVPAET